MEKKFPVNKQLISLLFFPLTILYNEFLLRLMVVESGFFDYHLLFVVGFSLAAGLMLWLLIGLIPSRKVRLVTSAVMTALLIVLFSVEYGVKHYYQTFFEFKTMLTMADEVVTQFASETLNGVLGAIPFVLLSSIPLVLMLLFKAYVIPEERPDWKARFWVLAAFVLLHSCTTMPLLMGADAFADDQSYFTTDYTAGGAIPRFGALTAVELELVYSFGGTPEDAVIDDTPIDEIVVTTPEPAEYDYNMMDIDFAALADSTTDKTLLSMHQYFAGKTPTQQNEYTGMFEGKNLILLCCEAFSPYFIDPELTPLLYKMSTEGFVFNNFWQPDWMQSTTGGECAVVTGLIPTYYNGQYTLTALSKNWLPFALGNQFSELGYATRSYHNHHYKYYSRHLSHPALGYDFKGVDGGLVLPHKTWPNSDREMMEVTVQEYIDNYVNNGENFHTYYMTVSGHTGYNWEGNSQSKKHRDEVQHLNYSETVKAYIACQLEVEYALQYIMERAEAAGIEDEIVIALTADHYPYALTTPQYNELQPKATAIGELDHYRNGFLLWSPSMEEPVVIDSPCSTIDIIPTLSNLFGLEYDSRLLSGRDILSTNYDVNDVDSPQPLVVFLDRGSGCSWINEAGQYDAAAKKFTPNPGYEEYANNTEYLSAMSAKAKNMVSMAKNIVAKDYYAVVLPKDTAQ